MESSSDGGELCTRQTFPIVAMSSPGTAPLSQTVYDADDCVAAPISLQLFSA
jgi:hypothetical protein